MLDQLHVNSTETVIPQNVQDDIDASYKLCITAVRKVKLEQSALKGENEKLSKDKSQLIEEKNQLLNENEYLKEQLAAAGEIL